MVHKQVRAIIYTYVLLVMMCGLASAADDWNVTWTPISESIIDKEYRIEVQNLQDVKRDVHISSFFDEMNFNTSEMRDIEFFEWKLLESEKLDWKACKSQLFTPTPHNLKTDYGLMNIPKLGSKDTGDGTYNGTKVFLLKFKTPIQVMGDGFGSAGKVAVLLDGVEYHPYWNTLWSSRKEIILTGGASGAQTDYQVLLNISWVTGMQADFDDLRFTNDTDEIDAWLESKVDSSYALIWVEFPTTPANGINQTYRMYYGNAGGSDWDIVATFVFADDFSGDLSKWNFADVQGSGGSASIVGGRLKIISKAANKHAGVSTSTFSSGILEVDIETNPNAAYQWGGAGFGDSETRHFLPQRIYTGTQQARVEWQIGGSGWQSAGTISASWITWYAKAIITGSTAKIYGKELKTDSWTAFKEDLSFTTTVPIRLASHDDNVAADGVAYFNNVRIRKYAANPPTYQFGAEDHYAGSIHYNTSSPYNHTIESDGTITTNRTIIAADDINWTAAAVSDDCQMLVTEYNLANTTIANFTLYNASLDWLKVTNLTVGMEYNLTNSTTYELQTADANGEANFTTDLILGDYQLLLLLPPSAPIITLLSQTPSVIYQNATGYLNISYGISHDSYGLNNTSVSFIFRNYDHTLNDANHSIRPPANDKCAPWEYNGQILRAANRNESLNFENNDTITGGDIYTWSGLDENQTRLTIIPVNSTYTIVNINGTVHDLAMEQMWYLDRTDMIDAPKTQLAIHKTQDVLIKFWDAEIFKGNYNFIGAGYTDTSLNSASASQPTDANPISFYYLNSSYDPLGGVDPLDSGYAVYMGLLNASQWIDHVYSPNQNASYVQGLINNTLLHSVINTTEISYLYFKSNTPSSKPYYINITDVSTITNRTFGQTDVLWIGDTAPYTAHPYTPNVWFAFIYENTSFDHKLYVAGASGLWSNSTLNRTYIGVGQFPPTQPFIHHFHYNGMVDYDMDGYYIGNFTIGCGVSTDPDGGIVTHNLTLHYANNLTLVAIINNTFTDTDITHNGVFADIAFNSTPYLSDTVQYTLKLVATDDEGDTAETWLGVDFWLAERPTIPIIFEIFVLMILFAVGMMMYSFLVVDLDNYTHILAAFLSGIVYILSGFSVFDGITFYGDDVLLGTDQTGWVALVFVIIGAIMLVYACVLGLDTAKEVIDELEESTT